MRTVKKENVAVYNAIERAARQLETFTIRDVNKRVKKGKAITRAAVSRMERRGLLEIVDRKPTGKRGRPMAVYQVVNDG